MVIDTNKHEDGGHLQTEELMPAFVRQQGVFILTHY